MQCPNASQDLCTLRAPQVKHPIMQWGSTLPTHLPPAPTHQALTPGTAAPCRDEAQRADPSGQGDAGNGVPTSVCSAHPALTAQKGCSGSREQGFKSRLPPSHPPQPFPKAPSSLAQPWAGGGWPAALPAAPHYSQYRPSVGCRTPRVCAVLQGENSDNIRDIKLQAAQRAWAYVGLRSALRQDPGTMQGAHI